MKKHTRKNKKTKKIKGGANPERFFMNKVTRELIDKLTGKPANRNNNDVVNALVAEGWGGGGGGSGTKRKGEKARPTASNRSESASKASASTSNANEEASNRSASASKRSSVASKASVTASNGSPAASKQSAAFSYRPAPAGPTPLTRSPSGQSIELLYSLQINDNNNNSPISHNYGDLSLKGEDLNLFKSEQQKVFHFFGIDIGEEAQRGIDFALSHLGHLNISTIEEVSSLNDFNSRQLKALIKAQKRPLETINEYGPERIAEKQIMRHKEILENAGWSAVVISSRCLSQVSKLLETEFDTIGRGNYSVHKVVPISVMSIHPTDVKGKSKAAVAVKDQTNKYGIILSELNFRFTTQSDSVAAKARSLRNLSQVAANQFPPDVSLKCFGIIEEEPQEGVRQLFETIVETNQPINEASSGGGAENKKGKGKRKTGEHVVVEVVKRTPIPAKLIKGATSAVGAHWDLGSHDIKLFNQILLHLLRDIINAEQLIELAKYLSENETVMATPILNGTTDIIQNLIGIQEEMWARLTTVGLFSMIQQPFNISRVKRIIQVAVIKLMVESLEKIISEKPEQINDDDFEYEPTVLDEYHKQVETLNIKRSLLLQKLKEEYGKFSFGNPRAENCFTDMDTRAYETGVVLVNACKRMIEAKFCEGTNLGFLLKGKIELPQKKLKDQRQEEALDEFNISVSKQAQWDIMYFLLAKQNGIVISDVLVETARRAIAQIRDDMRQHVSTKRGESANIKGMYLRLSPKLPNIVQAELEDIKNALAENFTMDKTTILSISSKSFQHYLKLFTGVALAKELDTFKSSNHKSSGSDYMFTKHGSEGRDLYNFVTSVSHEPLPDPSASGMFQAGMQAPSKAKFSS
jgi:hypothetical protein